MYDQTPSANVFHSINLQICAMFSWFAFNLRCLTRVIQIVSGFNFRFLFFIYFVFSYICFICSLIVQIVSVLRSKAAICMIHEQNMIYY